MWVRGWECVSFPRTASLFLACPEPFSATGAELEPSLWWGRMGDWETQLLLSFMRCIYLVLKGTSVFPYQQRADLPRPTTAGDGRSRGDLSPSLLFLVNREQQLVGVAQGMGKATSAGWNGGGCVPTLHPHRLESAGLCYCPSCCWLDEGGVGAGLQCLHSISIHCKSSPTTGDRLGIHSCKAAGWEGGFWPEWVLEFGHLSSGVVLLQSAVLWTWHWALLSQGHRRLMVLLTVIDAW